METLVAIIIAKLFDPLTAIIGIACGVWTKHWWGIVHAGLAATIICEAVAVATIPHHQFDTTTIMIGALAGAAWALIARTVRSKIRQSGK